MIDFNCYLSLCHRTCPLASLLRHPQSLGHRQTPFRTTPLDRSPTRNSITLAGHTRGPTQPPRTISSLRTRHLRRPDRTPGNALATALRFLTFRVIIWRAVEISKLYSMAERIKKEPVRIASFTSILRRFESRY